MTLYLILFCICFFYAVYTNRRLGYLGEQANTCAGPQPQSHIELVPLLFLFACISGFRYNLGGTDYYLYQNFYELIEGQQNFLYTIRESKCEIGYTTYVYVCSHILSLSFNGSLVLESAVFYTLMYLGLKRYIPNWGIFLMVFMYKMFFYVTFVIMRQAFTIAGFFYIMRYLQERKMIKYYVTLVFVSTFHYGALILFILYPIFGLNIKKERLALIGFIFGATTILSNMTGSFLNVMVGLLGLTQLEQKSELYCTRENLSILYTIEYYLLYFLMVKNYDKIKKRFKHADFIIIMYLLILPIVTLFRSTLILVREMPYFYPTYAVLLYYVYAVSKYRIIIMFVFSALCLLGLLKYMIQFDNGHFLTYNTWIFNPYVNFFK